MKIRRTAGTLRLSGREQDRRYNMTKRILASGNEAIAMAAFDCGVNLGTGYPGTPSSEILDQFNKDVFC